MDSVIGLGLHCLKCGHDWGVVLVDDEPEPTNCPKCGAKRMKEGKSDE